jgi:hypothetical protein
MKFAFAVDEISKGSTRRIFMKIDPSEKQQHILSSPIVKPTERGTADSQFSKVLGETVQKSCRAQTQQSGVLQPSIAPSMVVSIDPVQKSSEFTTAHRLLDALEQYQNLIGNPEANLKTVAPAVDHMKSLTKKAQPILDNMPEGHPIKTVTQEALMEMSKEIERFNAGYYVDE